MAKGVDIVSVRRSAASQTFLDKSDEYLKEYLEKYCTLFKMLAFRR